MRWLDELVSSSQIWQAEVRHSADRQEACMVDAAPLLAGASTSVYGTELRSGTSAHPPLSGKADMSQGVRNTP